MFIDMENTLSIPVALLAQGPLRIDGVTYYRHGNKVRACKSQRGPRKVRREGEEESSNRFTEFIVVLSGTYRYGGLWPKKRGLIKVILCFILKTGDVFDREWEFGLSRPSVFQ